MLPKKPEKTVMIGIATAMEIKKELMYQMLIFLILISYNTLLQLYLNLTPLIRICGAHNDLGRVNYLRKKDYEHCH